MRLGSRRPRLSVIVIAFDMARELPRTIASLSPALQRGVAAEDYEVIVVDNGSRRPADPAALRAHIPKVRLLSQRSPTPSPTPAIHTGLAAARGDLVGVFIDGARMASPGLLAGALLADQLHEKPVIGTLGRHLGPAPQFESVPAGYDQAREDALLEGADWREDGYRLFGISVFGASASGGWLAMPNETNSLFLRRRHWRQMKGVYDRRFVSPGGGLVNLDAWKRLAEDPTAQPIVLLGEATFHQVHGGVAASAPPATWAVFAEEYAQIRGAAFAPPKREPLWLGAFNTHSRAALASGAAGV